MKKIEKKYNLIIGRHCSVKKPEFLSGAVKETVGYGANALMFFLGSPRNSYRRTLEDSEIIKFKNSLKENNINIDNVVVHSSYLLNLANTVKEETFIRSVNALKKELVIMKKIGLKTIVLHPGSSIFDSLTEKSLLKLVEGLNLTLKTNSDIRIALETMSGRRGEIGKNFEQLKFILDRIKKKKKVGICWDTCHLFAYGYDIKNNFEKVLKEFKEKIGLKKLWVIHINDSVFDIGERKDRHENIGYGKIGFVALKKIVFYPEFNGLIKLLETPRKRNIWKEEINQLKTSKAPYPVDDSTR